MSKGFKINRETNNLYQKKKKEYWITRSGRIAVITCFKVVGVVVTFCGYIVDRIGGNRIVPFNTWDYEGNDRNGDREDDLIKPQ